MLARWSKSSREARPAAVERSTDDVRAVGRDPQLDVGARAGRRWWSCRPASSLDGVGAETSRCRSAEGGRGCESAGDPRAGRGAKAAGPLAAGRGAPAARPSCRRLRCQGRRSRPRNVGTCAGRRPGCGHRSRLRWLSRASTVEGVARAAPPRAHAFLAPRRSPRSRRSWRAARRPCRRRAHPWCRRRRPAWWPR